MSVSWMASRLLMLMMILFMYYSILILDFNLDNLNTILFGGLSYYLIIQK